MPAPTWTARGTRRSDYTDYTDAYDAYYDASVTPALLEYDKYLDDDGNIINPRQHIVGTDHFKKMSQELRVATPADKPIRGILGGAFYQDQKNHIFQDYLVDNLATDLSVTGYPGIDLG